MNSIAILAPCFAMAGITFIVWLRLYLERFGEMRARRIRPQAIATSRRAAETLVNTRAADNLRNLFEMPVLFYAACLLAYVTGTVTGPLVFAAWVFVLLRAVHSLIHCTYNRVTHRFAVYVLSTLVLFSEWLLLGIGLLQA